MNFASKAEFCSHFARYLKDGERIAFEKAMQKIDEGAIISADLVCRYAPEKARAALKNGILNDAVANDDFVGAYYFAKAAEGLVCRIGLSGDELGKCYEYLKNKRPVFEITDKNSTVMRLCFARAFFDTLRFFARQLGNEDEFGEFLNARNGFDAKIDACYDGRFYLDTNATRSIPSPYASLVPLAQMQADMERADKIISGIECVKEAMTHERLGAFALIPSVQGLSTYEYDSAADDMKEWACSKYVEGAIGWTDEVDSAELAAIIAQLALIG